MGFSSTSITTANSLAMQYVGDMVQQQWNAGFLGARAKLGCRSCFISDSDGRGDLEYDIVDYGRYHYQTLALRKEIHRLPKGRQREALGSKLGMHVGEFIDLPFL